MKRPTLEQALAVSLDQAEANESYSLPLRQRLVRVDVLPRLRVADLWVIPSASIDPAPRERWAVGHGYRAAWVEYDGGWWAYVRQADTSHRRLGPFAHVDDLLARDEAMAAADQELEEREGWVLVGGRARGKPWHVDLQAAEGHGDLTMAALTGAFERYMLATTQEPNRLWVHPTDLHLFRRREPSLGQLDPVPGSWMMGMRLHHSPRAGEWAVGRTP
jgi:hypothetical protein